MGRREDEHEGERHVPPGDDHRETQPDQRTGSLGRRGRPDVAGPGPHTHGQREGAQNDEQEREGGAAIEGDVGR